MYLLGPFKIFKKFLEPIQSYEDKPFLGPKWSICPEQIFLVQTIIITLIYLLALFIVQNFLKNLTTDPQLWGCSIFGLKMVHLSQKNFLEKNVNIIFIYLLVPFIVQNFKTIIKADTELWGCTIFGSKMAHLPKQFFFFRKPVNKPCFFHSSLSLCQKSRSDINLLKKYWWLKNAENSMAKSHFWL